MTRAFARFTGVLAILAFFSIWAFGQREAGQINGTITDTSGAVVSGAKVTVKSVNTGATRTATTNATGNYNVSGLKPDTYDVAVEAPGFAKFNRTVQVAVGSANEVSAQLAVGAAGNTVVEVTAAGGAATVNTENQTISQSVTQHQLEELPTSPTRNPYTLVGISGNVAEDTMSNRGAGFSINGQRSASTDILLDGGENVDAFTATVGQQVPLDSVQEFSVLTNNFTAEYGRAAGGVVNLVTKSGTNAFHGSAYEFNRLSALSSNTEANNSQVNQVTLVPDPTPKSTFTRNNFGFSVGGPIIKNKLFFFNNTEWVRVRSVGSQTLTIVDPASYTNLAANTQAYFAQFGALKPGVQLSPVGQCDSSVAGVNCSVAKFNVPSDAGGGNPQNTWEEVARVDFNITDKTSLFGRYASYKENDFAGVVNFSPYVGYDTPQTNYDQNFELSATHVFSPTVVDTGKFIFNRINGPVQPLGTAPVGPTLYTSVSSVFSVGNNPFIFPGYSEQTPGNAIPFGGPQNVYQFSNDLSWTKGKHQFKFGGGFIQLRDNRIFGAYQNAVEGLGTSLSSAVAALVSGNIAQFEGAVNPQGEFPCVRDINTGVPIQTPACTLTLPVGPPSFNRNYRYNDFSVYGQDSYKVTSRFTLNYGLRWEYYGVQHNAPNTNLDSNFVMGPGATIFDQIRNGSVKLAKDGGVFWNPDYHSFGPRIGFAYDVFGDGKTSLRGGFARSFERNFGNVTFNAIQNPPAYGVVVITAGVDVPTIPLTTDNSGPLAGTGTKALPPVSQRAINQNLKNAYADTWNLSVDRQIGKGVFSVSYAGAHAIHLYSIANINLGHYGNVFLGDARHSNRLNLQYSSMNFRSDDSYSHYNALNLRYAASNLWNKGLGVTTNYTWSHSLDNLSSTFSDGTASNYGLGYLDAFNPKLNYGNSDFDIRHRLNAAVSWDLPFARSSSSAVARNVLGGWVLSSIFNVRSGLPFSIYDCNNFSGQNCPQWIPPSAVPTTGSATPAPNIPGAGPTGGPLVQTNTYNYIALPNVGGTFGTVANPGDSLGIPNCAGLLHQGCTYTTSGLPYPGRNGFYGPGYWNVDMNILKNFKLTERFGLQFRAEMYNIFNHHNQYILAQNLDISSMTTPFIQTEKGGIFGISGQSATDERRNIQFGLKLTF